MIINTAKQQEFIDCLLRGDNIFLTGKAGTGKSHITKAGIELLKKNGKTAIELGIAIDSTTLNTDSHE